MQGVCGYPDYGSVHPDVPQGRIGGLLLQISVGRDNKNSCGGDDDENRMGLQGARRETLAALYT